MGAKLLSVGAKRKMPKWRLVSPEGLASLKVKQHLKIGCPKRKGSSSNHHFSTGHQILFFGQERVFFCPSSIKSFGGHIPAVLNVYFINTNDLIWLVISTLDHPHKDSAGNGENIMKIKIIETPRIHGTGIFFNLNLGNISWYMVGKYTSPMDSLWVVIHLCSFAFPAIFQPRICSQVSLHVEGNRPNSQGVQNQQHPPLRSPQ